MKTRFLLLIGLGLIIWFAGRWYNSAVSHRQEQLQAPPAPAAENSPGFAEWKRLWSANNPPPNVLPPVPAANKQGETQAAFWCDGDGRPVPNELPRKKGSLEPAPQAVPLPPIPSTNQLPPPPLPMLTATATGAELGVEAKLDLILSKLEQLEKRVEVLDKRKQAGMLEKLGRILERVSQLESRLQGTEKAGSTEVEFHPFSWLREFFSMKWPPAEADPNVRIKQATGQSEDLRTIEKEWERMWSADHPSHLAPERVDGGMQ